MRIRELDKNKEQYRDLLLLADPSWEEIEKYLYKSRVFVLEDREVLSIVVIEEISKETLEIKNLATREDFQSRGYARKLMTYVLENFRGKKLLVGTGNSSFNNIAFYRSLGFRYSHRIRNFFIDNYDQAIYENGIQCVDILYFELNNK